ncbi:MAG: hypothetical protein J0L70_23195 [Leptolyngbya sp. UWPOB_LEPTO1]|uniref:hypothetical protein n=1 Tax=Leptolyngbya sp. UWPOB_LEPTO1 TaxID=2815653 RepID=UPI001ACC46D7|nr:hypothetical protein [Leptolyngbya sp. UWPOB_LEPTO1]MBN8563447.1 hypothetical protein [Leptolyngbya sp. UWPOB_LEPTO1]
MNTFQTPTTVPRKNAGYRLDERCIDAIKELANRTGKSINEYLEDLIFQHGKINGVIPPDAEPLGETRGGKRLGAGKPPKKSEQENDRADAEN